MMRLVFALFSLHHIFFFLPLLIIHHIFCQKSYYYLHNTQSKQARARIVESDAVQNFEFPDLGYIQKRSSEKKNRLLSHSPYISARIFPSIFLHISGD
jgi:hypothetical protein